MKSFFLKTIYWIDSSWKMLMDNRFNPLRHIPDPSIQGYFTLVLFTMWSFFFGLVATYYMGWYGYNGFISFVVHCSLIIPLLLTRAAFFRCRARWSKMVNSLKKANK